MRGRRRWRRSIRRSRPWTLPRCPNAVFRPGRRHSPTPLWISRQRRGICTGPDLVGLFDQSAARVLTRPPTTLRQGNRPDSSHIRAFAWNPPWVNSTMRIVPISPACSLGLGMGVQDLERGQDLFVKVSDMLPTRRHGGPTRFCLHSSRVRGGTSSRSATCCWVMICRSGSSMPSTCVCPARSQRRRPGLTRGDRTRPAERCPRGPFLAPKVALRGRVASSIDT